MPRKSKTLMRAYYFAPTRKRPRVVPTILVRMPHYVVRITYQSMTGLPDMKKNLTDDLADHISLIIKALLIAGRKGAPAEGRLPFNPLYFHLLRQLSQRGRARPSDLAADLSVARTTISTAIKALQKRELVTTKPDASDGRAISVLLTDQGDEVVKAIQRQDQRNASATLAAIDPDQRAGLVAMLGQIATTLNQAPEGEAFDENPEVSRSR